MMRWALQEERGKSLRLAVHLYAAPAIHSFIVFRYIFIVQQFADVQAVHLMKFALRDL